MAGSPSDRRFPSPERICDLYIITMLLIFPLFPGFSGYGSITLSKYIFFLSATGLWLLALCGSLLRSRLPLPRPGAAGIAALVFLGLCLLSWLCSPHRAEAFLGAGRFDGLLTDLCYVLIFLGISAFARPKKLHACAFAAAITLCGLLSLFQLAGANPLKLFPEDLSFYDSGLRYSGSYLGTIGNTNILDAVLCLALPAFFALYVCGEGGLFLLPVLISVPTVLKAGGDGGALALLLAAAVSLPLLLTELPRIRRALRGGAWLLLAAAFSALWQPEPSAPLRFTRSSAALWPALGALAAFVASLCPYPKSFAPRKAGLRRFFALVTVVILLLALGFVLLSSSDSGTVFELRETLSGHAEDGFGSSRIRIWRACIALFPERPLLGGGPGTLALRLDVRFSRYVPETGATLRSFVDNAHNYYLAALCDLGISGLTALLALLLLAAVSALKRAEEPLYSSAALGAFCCAVHEFFGLALCISMPLLWLCLGLLCARRSEAVFPSEGST